MPARPTPLPQPFCDGEPFTVAEALGRGVPRNRLYLKDLHRPFAGVRATRAPVTVRELAHAYALRMGPAEFFSHMTAAALHDMWLPRGSAGPGVPIDVAVFEPLRAPRDAGVRGHHLTFRGQHLRSVDGVMTLGEVETWCQLAEVLTVDELVVAADGLLQPGSHQPDSLLRELRRAAALPGRRGRARLLSALELVRPRVRSPQESRLRLLIVRSGRTEPLVNVEVKDAAGRFVAEVDLAYPERRVALEYEGDHHRTDAHQFQKDIRRRELLLDVDWWILRVTGPDLHGHAAELLQRLDRALAPREGR